MVFLGSLSSDEVQYLVFSFSWNTGVTKYDFEAFPLGAGGQPPGDVGLQHFRDFQHEICAWSNHIVVPVGVLSYCIGHFGALSPPKVEKSLLSPAPFGDISCRLEPSSSLLVHLCPRGHSVNSEVEYLLGVHDIHEHVDVVSDVTPHLLSALRDGDSGLSLRVRAGVDDTIHV